MASSPQCIVFDSYGNVTVQLPQGAKKDSFRLYFFVQVIDDLGAITVYNLSTPCVVEPNSTLADSLTSDILSTNSSFLENINSFDTKTALNMVLGVASLLEVSALSSDNSSENSNSVLKKKFCLSFIK